VKKVAKGKTKGLEILKKYVEPSSAEIVKESVRLLNIARKSALEEIPEIVKEHVRLLNIARSVGSKQNRKEHVSPGGLSLFENRKSALEKIRQVLDRNKLKGAVTELKLGQHAGHSTVSVEEKASVLYELFGDRENDKKGFLIINKVIVTEQMKNCISLFKRHARKAIKKAAKTTKVVVEPKKPKKGSAQAKTLANEAKAQAKADRDAKAQAKADKKAKAKVIAPVVEQTQQEIQKAKERADWAALKAESKAKAAINIAKKAKAKADAKAKAKAKAKA
jgi:hypothetical protein